MRRPSSTFLIRRKPTVLKHQYSTVLENLLPTVPAKLGLGVRRSTFLPGPRLIAQGNESIDIDSLYISWIGTPRCKTPQKKKITSGWDDAIRIAEMVSGSIDWAGAAEQVSRAFPIQHGLPCTRPGNLQNAATFKRGTWTPFFAYAGCADWRNECTIGKQVSRTEMNLQRYIADK
jgi:hypothetical protein